MEVSVEIYQHSHIRLCNLKIDTITGTDYLLERELNGPAEQWHYMTMSSRQHFLNKLTSSLGSFTLHFGLKYEIIYQLDAIEYLFVFFASEDGCISPKHVELKEHK